MSCGPFMSMVFMQIVNCAPFVKKPVLENDERTNDDNYEEDNADYLVCEHEP
jgi:hypothetical protein